MRALPVRAVGGNMPYKACAKSAISLRTVKIKRRRDAASEQQNLRKTKDFKRLRPVGHFFGANEVEQLEGACCAFSPCCCCKLHKRTSGVWLDSTGPKQSGR